MVSEEGVVDIPFLKLPCLVVEQCKNFAANTILAPGVVGIGHHSLEEGHVYRCKLEQISKRDRRDVSVGAMPIDTVKFQ